MQCDGINPFRERSYSAMVLTPVARTYERHEVANLSARKCERHEGANLSARTFMRCVGIHPVARTVKRRKCNIKAGTNAGKRLKPAARNSERRQRVNQVARTFQQRNLIMQ